MIPQDELVDRVCARIAPTWPLDRFIAVNPFWEMTDAPLPALSAKLASLSGARLLMPRAWYAEAWREGRLRDEHLQAAIARRGRAVTVPYLVNLLHTAEPSVPRRARVMDVADRHRDPAREMRWRQFVIHTTSQLCASYFDESQAQLGPDRDGGLYATFRRHAERDRSPALLMGLASYGALARELPKTAREMTSAALEALNVPEGEREAYLLGLLLDLQGWASWCAYRRWAARLEGGDDASLGDLLAVRLAWEWLLLRAGGASLAHEWKGAMAEWGAADAAARASQEDDWLLQDAAEIAYQDELCTRLASGLVSATPSERPLVQAVFCIDVRSEVIRRALEAQSPRVETLGFAGFFGLPVEYQPAGGASARPQLPGLLAPRFRVTDTGVLADVAVHRAARLEVDAAWSAFKTSPLSTFAFVESMGIFAGGKLLAEAVGAGPRPASHERAGLAARDAAARKPRLTAKVDGAPLSNEDRVTLAAGVLRAMSLTRGFARLVVLVGHGSASRNNPHAAGLDCGACCGQSGEVNARAAAALLNDPEVRSGLATRGIVVPDDTRFLPALHETTTDEVAFFDLDELPAEHDADLVRLRGWLDAAAEQARAERAPRLGLAHRSGAALHASVRARARDWSQVRPEWGLADNAAFVVAPRAHARAFDFAGRAFLHEYRFEEDADFSILELVMTAPMVVCHWINLQYYASTVDNPRYGSGNKVLHNVVGGHIGVFEGNGGDLRIGLPMQSLHDGSRWVHTPLRLSVFIEAPQSAIEAIVRKHAKVRDLVDHAWLHLFQLDADARAVHAYRDAGWTRVAPRA